MTLRPSLSSPTVALVCVAVGVAGCGAHARPAARVGSAEEAVRTARDDGAAALPDAAVHLRLAEDQVARARRLIEEGEHERAEWFLRRAEADAALADALAREARERTAADSEASR